jgi:hypothetical protein
MVANLRAALRGRQTAVTIYASRFRKYACVFNSAEQPTLQESKSVFLRRFVTRVDLFDHAVVGSCPFRDCMSDSHDVSRTDSIFVFRFNNLPIT